MSLTGQVGLPIGRFPDIVEGQPEDSNWPVRVFDIEHGDLIFLSDENKLFHKIIPKIRP